MKALKETETHEATPEQLLQILDAQLVSQRSHKAAASRNRAMILVAGVLFIVGAAGAALMVLGQMLEDLRQNGPAAPAPAESRGNF
jgi:uncharacterized membrane protein